MCQGEPAKHTKLKLSRLTAEVIRCSQHVSSQAAANLENALIADVDEQDKLYRDKSELLVDKFKIDREKERVKDELLKLREMDADRKNLVCIQVDGKTDKLTGNMLEYTNISCKKQRKRVFTYESGKYKRDF